jgi:pilus assembly protein Flp/PilA
MFTTINSLRRNESGATMVEYGLLVALIALVVGLGAQVVGTQLSTIFSEIGSYVGSVTVPTA